MTLKDLASLILKHTVSSRSHLTPELVLRLITPGCPLWKAKEEELPFKDPFWAFYWPGGQAMARCVTSHANPRDTIQRNGAIICSESEILNHIGPAAADVPDMVPGKRKDNIQFTAETNYWTGLGGLVLTVAQIHQVPSSHARFILDNEVIVRNRRIIDIGCGCGAGAIAAAKMNADYVLANDIDEYATTATLINASLNQVDIQTSVKNFIGTDCTDFDTILIGDMFYDEEFANTLFDWLMTLSREGKMVLIGDPGRHGLTQKRLECLKLLAKYDLPEESCIENHGFKETTLWKINS